MKNINFDRKLRRKKRISANIFGTEVKPRIAIFRSNRYIYAQAIDDHKRNTLAFYSSLNIHNAKDYKKDKKVNEAKETGIRLAKMLLEKGVKTGIFDRSSYAYKGRVKALAEGLRQGGILI